MYRTVCTAIGAALALGLLLTAPASAYTCHVTQTSSATTYDSGPCTFHCWDGDRVVEHCLYKYETWDKNCTSNTVYCPLPCTLIKWKDYTRTTCLCEYLVGCDPVTTVYSTTEETCDVCGNE